MVSGLQSQKALIAIFNTHFYKQYICANTSMEYPKLKASQLTIACAIGDGRWPDVFSIYSAP